jgi:hypothetical protein
MHRALLFCCLSVLAVAFGVTSPAGAASGSFKSCRIVNGQVFSCDGAWYQGQAPVLSGGAFHSCHVVSGQVFSCDGAWYQGKAPALHDGAYHLCSIVNGQVFSCDGAWYQGQAVVYTDR